MELIQEHKIQILNHPVISTNLAIIRNKNTDCERFRLALRRISYFLIYEAAKSLPVMKKEVETPLVKTVCDVIDEEAQIIVAPILRAGLAFCEVAQEILPFSNVHHIGMYRDEKTLEPVWYYDKKKKIKEDKNKIHVLILDPMLATGNSAKDAISNFISKGVLEKNIVFVSLIASPEGVEKINSNYPNVKIISAALDEKLNSKGYILPGLGDAGDRIFNTAE